MPLSDRPGSEAARLPSFAHSRVPGGRPFRRWCIRPNGPGVACRNRSRARPGQARGPQGAAPHGNGRMGGRPRTCRVSETRSRHGRRIHTAGSGTGRAPEGSAHRCRAAVRRHRSGDSPRRGLFGTPECAVRRPSPRCHGPRGTTIGAEPVCKSGEGGADAFSGWAGSRERAGSVATASSNSRNCAGSWRSARLSCARLLPSCVLHVTGSSSSSAKDKRSWPPSVATHD